MDAWLDEVAAALGVAPLAEGDVAELLGLARDVAHGVERKVTPLAAFLLGAGVQRRVAEGASRTDAMAAAIADLRALVPAVG
jgi:hypothetical protein